MKVINRNRIYARDTINWRNRPRTALDTKEKTSYIPTGDPLVYKKDIIFNVYYPIIIIWWLWWCGASDLNVLHLNWWVYALLDNRGARWVIYIHAFSRQGWTECVRAIAFHIWLIYVSSQWFALIYPISVAHLTANSALINYIITVINLPRRKHSAHSNVFEYIIFYIYAQTCKIIISAIHNFRFDRFVASKWKWKTMKTACAYRARCTCVHPMIDANLVNG